MYFVPRYRTSLATGATLPNSYRFVVGGSVSWKLPMSNSHLGVPRQPYTVNYYGPGSVFVCTVKTGTIPLEPVKRYPVGRPSLSERQSIAWAEQP